MKGSLGLQSVALKASEIQLKRRGGGENKMGQRGVVNTDSSSWKRPKIERNSEQENIPVFILKERDSAILRSRKFLVPPNTLASKYFHKEARLNYIPHDKIKYPYS